MFTIVDAFALAGGLVLVVIGAFRLPVTSGSRQRRAARQMALGRSTLNAVKAPAPARSRQHGVFCFLVDTGRQQLA
jgi:hypothetical protein